MHDARHTNTHARDVRHVHIPTHACVHDTHTHPHIHTRARARARKARFPEPSVYCESMVITGI